MYPSIPRLMPSNVKLLTVSLITMALFCLAGCGDSTSSVSSRAVVTTGVVVYGATPSGIIAAIEAAKLGNQVVLLEPTQHVGGMMSNGLSFSDLYEMSAIGGLPNEFFQEINSAYGGTPGKSAYYFEPHIAEQVFNAMLAKYGNLTVALGASISSLNMTGAVITGLAASNGVSYDGQEYIDASYTGDLMAASNVSYTVGRESSAQYGESLGGVGTPFQGASKPIDPYIVPGDSSSGLIPHVFADSLGALGTADTSVMAYNYRLCVTPDRSNQIPFSAPDGYTSSEFELLGRLASTAKPALTAIGFYQASAVPNNKFDLNNAGLMSTDEVEESFKYPNGTVAVREQIESEQKRYMQALLYFIETDSRIPQTVQNGVKELGLCKDEFTDNGGWPHQIYVREARRMIGAYVMTEGDLKPTTTVSDAIGVGGFNVDDHYEHVVNNSGVVNWEARGAKSLGLYQIAYRVLTPQSSQATNLLVPVDVSASHVAYDSLRVEATFMIMGQAAGAAASLAMGENTTVQNVSYGALSKQLISDGAVLVPPVLTGLQELPYSAR